MDNNKEVNFKRDMVVHRKASMRVCKRCGRFYVLTDNDAVHFATTYGSIPYKCEDCRKSFRDSHPYNKEEV